MRAGFGDCMAVGVSTDEGGMYVSNAHGSRLDYTSI